MTVKLPPSLEGLTSFVDAQPEKVRDIYNYCLCLMMVAAGAMELVEKIAGDEGAVCVFESATGEKNFVSRPILSEQQERLMIHKLRQIMKDEGLFGDW